MRTAVSSAGRPTGTPRAVRRAESSAEGRDASKEVWDVGRCRRRSAEARADGADDVRGEVGVEEGEGTGGDVEEGLREQVVGRRRLGRGTEINLEGREVGRADGDGRRCILDEGSCGKDRCRGGRVHGVEAGDEQRKETLAGGAGERRGEEAKLRGVRRGQAQKESVQDVGVEGPTEEQKVRETGEVGVISPASGNAY